MVRSDAGAAGVMFSIDTETGFPRVVVINANWGLGETVVQGNVDPDEYRVSKPLLDHGELRPIIERRLGGKEHEFVYSRDASARTRMKRTSRGQRDAFVLNDDEILTLARWAVRIEQHYGRPMDMEWAKDGRTGELFVVQARPETVQACRDAAYLKAYVLKDTGAKLLAGLAIGDAVAMGAVCLLDSGLCGQRPSDDPTFVELLVRAGIDSISVTPDSFLAVKQHVAAAERATRIAPVRGARAG